ncbi:tripartite tricarboxylate transporter TctB family protein [Flaviflagellibacter deserti]|uniref:Tripartite tricarboxylate transporter TctB family protein n=1 Tax=Flaviflagellibacter deserti TaxID=2267266 RepID=A0ABV9Z1V6_9HYPH
MTIHRLDQFVALFLLLFGAYLVWTGLGFGFMQGTTPGAGYFPALAGGVLIVLSAINLVRSLAGLEDLKSRMARRDVVKFIAITAAMLVFVVITPFAGMTIATMLLMLAIGLIIRPSLERAYLVRLGITSIFFSLACLVVFGTLLRVPVPRGIFGL